PSTVHKKIGIGDIVIFSVKDKKYHVLIIQVYKPTELNKEVSFIQPKFKPFFLKKVAKGFKKTDYITISGEESSAASDKKQQINRKRPFTIRKTSK
ncbi:hypothetical protein ACQZP4_002756, partial [Enterococcus hirae]